MDDRRRTAWEAVLEEAERICAAREDGRDVEAGAALRLAQLVREFHRTVVAAPVAAPPRRGGAWTAAPAPMRAGR